MKRCSSYLLLFSILLTVPVSAEPVPVTIGVPSSASDVIVYIARKKGFFTEENLDVKFVPLDSAARMIAPLASGDLDAGSGGVSAGLFNAVGRGIGLKIVASKNSASPGRGIQPLLVRKQLVDSGRFKTLADLKGLKISTAAPGTSASTNLFKALQMGGLKITDVEQVYMGFPQQAVALMNNAIDAAFTAEPSASQVIASGAAVRVMGDDEIFPNHQLAVVLFSSQFIAKKNAAAHGYMRAYLKAARFYNDGVVNGRFAGARGEEVVAILSEFIPIRNNDLYRTMVAADCDPDGALNLASLREDLEFFRNSGLIKGETSVEDAVDTSFTESAVKQMGAYKPAR